MRRPNTYGTLTLSPTLADLVQAIGSDKSIWKIRREEIVADLTDLALEIGSR